MSKSFTTVLASTVAVAAFLAATGASAQARSFNVPSEDAAKAIPEFARQAGIHISAPVSGLKGVRTPAITGQQDVRAALAKLLEGTGLEVASDDGATVVLRRKLPAERGGAEAAPAQDIEAVVVTGTRSASITQFKALSPVDVLPSKSVTATVTNNLDETLAQLVPSFDVKRLPASDGAQFIRPASLDNLSPDMTMVLLNGKRFHHTAWVNGAQPADLSQISNFGVGHIELLRDGASAQYGSDAIAGVVNIILNTRPGLDLYAQGSRYYAGDGNSGVLGGRWATDLPGGGHVMATVEYSATGSTSRSIQRADAIAFQAANPGLKTPNPVQNWGNPDTHALKGVFDAAKPLGDLAELYVFGTLGKGSGIADINWRNPTSNPTVFNQAPTIFPGFNLLSIYPTGFTPREGDRYTDQQIDFGIRHKNSDVFTWDLSGSYGHNDTEFFLDNSINASLGPASPLKFNLGHWIDTEYDLNADGNYRLRLPFLADPLNIAFGAERREDVFQMAAGDPASYVVGPGAAVGLVPQSNGFPGIAPSQVGSWSQLSYAGYLDVQTMLTRQWSVDVAGRDESFSGFGNTFNYKVATRYEFTPALAVRGSYSTGFKAPTTGQLYSTSTGQSLDSKTLQVQTSGRLSPLNPVAEFFGATPLRPEESKTLTGGLVWRTDIGLSGSVDAYKIDIDHRFSTSPSTTIKPADVAMLVALGVPGAGSFTSINFFTNAFSTSTRGVDVTLAYTRSLGPGKLDLNGAYSYTGTKVTGGSLTTAANAVNKVLFEQSQPSHNAMARATYTIDKFSFMASARYYGSWTDTTQNVSGNVFQAFPGITFLDLAVTYNIDSHFLVRVGAENAPNTYPAKSIANINRGVIYSRQSPYDTNGGNVYMRLEAHF
jgi:iron complex outermembrane receptor protein